MPEFIVSYSRPVTAESANHAALVLGHSFLPPYGTPKDFDNGTYSVGTLDMHVVDADGNEQDINLREAYLATKGMDFYGVSRVFIPFNRLTPELQTVARYLYDEHKAADDTDTAEDWEWRINTLNGKLHPSYQLHYINKNGFEVLRCGQAMKTDWPHEEILGEDGYIYDQFDRKNPIVSLGKFPREYATESEAYANRTRNLLYR